MLPGFTRRKCHTYGVCISTRYLPNFQFNVIFCFNEINTMNNLEGPLDIPNDRVHLVDNPNVNSLDQLIAKARQQCSNCLDLSKRNLTQFPTQLLDFPSLQVNSSVCSRFQIFFLDIVSVLRRKSTETIA